VAGPDNQRWAGYLPPDTTSFIGRSAELAEINRLLDEFRLVTLTGPSGIGKTRLARRAAAGLRGEFSHGAWFVDLAGLPDPDLIPLVVTRALRAQDQSERPAAEALADYLAGKRLLLVLDSCAEHAAACAELIGALLPAAPGLTVLATAADALGVPDERAFPVPPLPPPDCDDADAMTLLLDRLGRARAADGAAGHEPDAEHDRDGLRELCRMLGGVPLGLELAAARLAEMPVDAAVTGLGKWLGRHERAAGETSPETALRAALDWTHELCTAEERRLWLALSVFAPGFDAQAAHFAAERVRPGSGERGPSPDRLAALGLLTARADSGDVRYLLPGAVAAYGRRLLRELGDESIALEAHRDFYLRRAREGEVAWAGGEQVNWRRRLDRDLPNIRAALGFCLRRPAEHEAGLLMACSLWYLWLAGGCAREGRRYLDRLLKVATAPSPTRTKALWVCGGVAAVQGDLEWARSRANQCLGRADQEGDMAAAGYGTHVLGTVALLSGDNATAISKLTGAIGRHRVTGELTPGLLVGLPQLAVAYELSGEPEQAHALLGECLAKCNEAGELWARGMAVHAKGAMAFRAGDLDSAWAHARDALRIKRLFDDVAGSALCLELLAWVAAGQGSAERAARLLGAAQENWSLYGLSHAGSPFTIPQHGECERIARDTLGDAAYEAALEEGRRLDLSDAIAYALGEDLSPVIN
jgi:predicted ATPase